MKFSVIVPVYKVEKYICSCIESILNQKYSDFELLLIDDGSPDNSGEICDEYARSDERVRVFHQNNYGVSSARNVGLENSSGEYILFVDADDVLYPDALFILKKTIETAHKDIDLVQFSMNNEYNIYEKDNKSSDILDSENYLEAKVFNVCVWGSLYKIDLIRKNNIRFNEAMRYAEDQLFFVEYLKHSKANLRINNVLYYYRLTNTDSALHNQTPIEIVKSIDSIIQYKKTNDLSKRVLDNTLLSFIYYLALKTNYPILRIYKLYHKSNIKNVAVNSKGILLFYKITQFSPMLAILTAKLYGGILK